jgi:hypothetical protein
LRKSLSIGMSDHANARRDRVSPSTEQAVPMDKIRIGRPPLPAVFVGAVLLCLAGIVGVAFTGSWWVMGLVAGLVIVIVLLIAVEVLQQAGGT